jgi:triosephosphate isomerase
MGNWKMYKTVQEARSFAEQLGTQAAKLTSDIDYAIFPPFTAFHVLRVTLPTSVALGAQNMFYEAQGAFTGEISGPMLHDLGIRYVLVGHSERRNIFGETDEDVRKKVKAVVAHGMTPVLCVGENLEEKQKGSTLEVVERQVSLGLADLSSEEVANSVIAYEPVWAIGSGLTPTPEDAEAVIRAIRERVARDKGQSAAEGVRILYGGSVKPDNIASFTAQPNIDGALVGGASLEAASFVKMAEAVKTGV